MTAGPLIDSKAAARKQRVNADSNNKKPKGRCSMLPLKRNDVFQILLVLFLIFGCANGAGRLEADADTLFPVTPEVNDEKDSAALSSEGLTEVAAHTSAKVCVLEASD